MANSPGVTEPVEATPSDEPTVPPIAIIGLGLAVVFLIYKVITSHQSANAAAAKSQQSSVGTPQILGNAPYVAHTDNFVSTNDVKDSYNVGIGAGATAPVTNNQTTFVPSAAPPHQGEPPEHKEPPKKPKPVPAPKSPKGTWTCRYTVKEGDTLTAIGKLYGTTWEAIYGHNMRVIDAVALLMHNVIPGGNWNNIRPGEVLFVPCK
jgi:LysM repeat protein